MRKNSGRSVVDVDCVINCPMAVVFQEHIATHAYYLRLAKKVIVSGGFPPYHLVFVRVWNKCAPNIIKKLLEIKHHFQPPQTSPPPKREASSCSQTQPCWRHVFYLRV